MNNTSHWADPCYVVECDDGVRRGHSGRRVLARQLAVDLDEKHPERAPHQVRKTSFNEVGD